MSLAITRAVGPSLGECALTYRPRVPIDVARAREQHAAYREALRDAGAEVVLLAADPDLPDAVFVEDAAVVLDEVAVAARPASVLRRREVGAVAEALAAHRRIERIGEPATLEGGDVLRVGRTLLVGLSPRTNEAGLAQLAAVAAPLGYRVRAVPVRGCLHLKTAVTALDDETLLVNGAWIEAAVLGGRRRIDVHEDEPFAANTLSLGSVVFVAASAPRTRERLERAGYATRAVDVGEFEKAEGGLTCLSLIGTEERWS